VRATLTGAGALEALYGPYEGKVLASFPKACYLVLPRGLAALVGPKVHPGPIHVILDAQPPRLTPQSIVRVSHGWLLVDDYAVPLAGAPVWRGTLPSTERFRRATGVASEVAGRLAEHSALSSDTALRDRCLACLRAGDLKETAALLSGRGAGFTPAGDDALLGVLLVLRAAWGRKAEKRLLPIAEATPTGVVARSMLSWAARGQALAPIHDLLCAAAAGDTATAWAAAEALAGVGHSSGADTALGLSWGAQTVWQEEFSFLETGR
jgi:hypothetical protein